jgi:adenylate kinase family enzyme
VERVVVVGTSGSGKSTVARHISAALAAPYLELDSLCHQAGWVELDLPEFRRRVEEFAAGDRWVIDGHYQSRLGDLVLDRADTLVWLDLPRPVVMRRVITRTVRRAIMREELWNGNREPLSNVYRWDPEHSVIRWAWTTHHELHDRYAAAASDPRLARLTFVQLRSANEVDRWLATLA